MNSPYREAPTRMSQTFDHLVVRLKFLATCRVIRRYIVGLMPFVALLSAYSVGHFVWCGVFGGSDPEQMRYNRDGLYFFIWFVGLVIICSPVWATRLGKWLISELFPSWKDSD